MQREKTLGVARYLAALGVCLLIALALAPTAAFAAGHEHDGVTFTEWTSTTTLPNTAGSYYLADDVTLSGTWSVPPGGVNLCLDGHTVKMSSGYYFIDVPAGSTLDLYDKADNSGTLQGDDKYGCMDVVGSFTMHGGTITRTISGVDIFAIGGGAGSFTMEGGVIIALKNGAGVMIGEDEYSGTFVMTGGTISGNEAQGGVKLNNGTMSVSGAVTVADNKRDSKAQNVFLSTDAVITVSDALTCDLPIGVTTETKPTKEAPVVITSGYGAKMGTENPSMYFASDDPAYVIAWNNDKTEVVLAVEGSVVQDYSVTVSATEHGKVTADKATAAAGAKVTLTITSDEGYELDSLTVKSGETTVEVKDNAFTMPEGDVTVTAAFKAKAPDPKPEPGPEPEPVAKIEMQRLYNPYSYEHFYTSDAEELAGLVELGWEAEGLGWVAPETSDVPVYRLYNPNNGGDHHYTTNAEERDALVAAGWHDEGTGWYSAGEDGVPVYREYNPFELVRNHNYTASLEEHTGLVAMGWHDEDIAWYGL